MFIDENARYHNYHKHDHKGNWVVLDTIETIENYCKRAVELGHDTIFTTNHGFQGDLFEALDTAKKYGLKVIVGAEAYYVPDRLAEDENGRKDKSNRHIVVIALNNAGVREINSMISEACISGFYYRPRIDEELLFSLNPKNVVVTSACVAGVWHNKDDYDQVDSELLLMLHNYFGDHFFLEVQNHDEKVQIEANKKILEFSRLTGIKIIHGNDSHYCYPEDKEYRDLFLKAKRDKKKQKKQVSEVSTIEPEEDENEEVNINADSNEHEDNFILDYPSAGEIYRRYKKQGVLNDEEIKEAIENTLVFDECEELTLINDDIKLPSISDDPYNELNEIIKEAWARERPNIPRHRWKEYVDAIVDELKVIHDTHMEDYFIIDHKIVKLAQEKYNGKLTNTGRGSAPSFYVVKLLGLTDIDRLDSPITLFPSRFMSVERILGARSLPDIDLNTADAAPFIQATKDLLGEENCAWMIAWKPLQDSSAFRLWCKAKGLDIDEYDDVAKNLDEYREDKYWKPFINGSKKFIGVVEGISESPCSMLLYNKPVREEIGLIRLTSKNSKNKICCLISKSACDRYHYLKNDYLTVVVWAIIRETCELAGIPIPTIRELDNLLDEKTFEIYEKGLTCSINQADSDYATGLVKTYKPKSLAEMSAFVAIIRPGCLSLLDGFIHREGYTTNIKELDELLKEGSHRMIYQELIMKYLIWLGIPEPVTYDIIKKISKKKFKEKELAELKEKLLSGWIKNVGTEEGFVETWTVVEQAAKYSFNACLAGDTIIQTPGCKLFSHNYSIEKMYRIKNDYSYAVENGCLREHQIYKKHGYGKALSMFNDGTIKQNQIIDIRESGVQKIYRVRVTSGEYIDCTMNHKFPTLQGKKMLCELSVGDSLYVKSGPKIDNVRSVDEEYGNNIRTIASIQYLKTDMTYDVEMAEPAHTIVSESGLVASNSHSLSYAYDSLYGAYLKSHYPLEYYTVAFNYYDEDLTRTAKLTQELDYFDIKLEKIKFRYSRAKYSCDKDTRSIYKGIGSIKYLNAGVAEALYELREERFKNFFQLLNRVFSEKIATNRQVTILAKLNFFEEFGDINALLACMDLYSDFAGLTNPAKTKFEQRNIPTELVLECCEKATAKQYRGFRPEQFFNLMVNQIKVAPVKPEDIIEYQDEYMGYVDYVDPNFKGRKYVRSLDTKYSPKVVLYSIGDGQTENCKISKRLFKDNPFEEKDTLVGVKTESRPKTFKNADGGWEEVEGQTETWITRYTIMRK